MSNTTERRAARQHAHRVHWMLAGGTTLAVAGLIALAVWAARGSDAGAGVAEPTKATNSMGMPILEKTPGSGTGIAETDGASASPQRWELGRVPLNVAVTPKWVITNTGTDVINVGQPHVEINQGCCPGALTYDGPTSLQPNQTVGLTFELSMHPGMDGAHDMTLHVPVTHADGTPTTLALSVTGDFRD